MSETKFTKGPWVIKPLEEDKEYIRIRGGVIGGRFKIANVTDLHLHHNDAKWCKMEREESIANANLIAKAPDMYEMLESVRNELYQLIDEVNDQRASKITSQTENEPDYHDQEMIHLIDVLLAEIRGDK